MNKLAVPLLLVSIGCKPPAPDPFDPDAIATLPSWVEDEWNANDDSCSSAYQWDAATAATTFYAGQFYINGETFVGNEFWLLNPNQNLRDALGFEKCTVVWDTIGKVVQPEEGGAAFDLQLSASIDEDQTDCVLDLNDNPIYDGQEEFSQLYEVFEGPNGSVTMRFPSGTEFGKGRKDISGLTWMSEKDCKYF